MSCAYVFDLDGTLVESLPGICAALNESLRGHGLPEHPISAVRGMIGDGAKVLCTRAVAPERSPDLIDSVLAGLHESYGKHWEAGTAPFAGIAELLADLQHAGAKLGVLSNKPDLFTKAIVHHYFPKISFKIVLGDTPNRARKPDPTVLLEIAAQWQIMPAELTLIGDSLIDLSAAKNAGAKAIAVTWGYHDREALEAAEASALADTVDELRSLLIS